MSSFAAWGLTVLGLAVVSTIAEMLLPQGKTRKVIRSVFATVTVLTVITPIPLIKNHGFNFDFSSDVVQTDGEYIEYVDGARRELIASAGEQYLKSVGYDGVDVEVETDDGWNVISARINLSGLGITENGEHINKSEIIGLIADYFGIGEEAVMTYG